MSTPTASRRLHVEHDLRATVGAFGSHGFDLTHRRSPHAFARAVLTPDGPGTMLLEWTDDGDVDASAWGSGADWLLDVAPRWLGAGDDLDGFDPTLDPRIARAWRDRGGFRLAASGVIWQELLLVLLGQRVTTREASKSFTRMVESWGEPAPGPLGLRLPPTPAAIAERTYVDLHRMNVERRRADAILLAARRASRLEEAATMGPADALDRLQALPGLGVWTATSTVAACHGHADTIVLRDYGMPTMVNYFFTGDGRHLDADRGGDETMCAQLAPWSGHRQRIVRLIKRSSGFPPRRAPRAFNPDIRRL